MKYLLSILLIVALGGCATHRPQARVIDATNKAPWFSRSVEKGTHQNDHRDVVNESTGKLESHQESTTARKVSYDFTF